MIGINLWRTQIMSEWHANGPNSDWHSLNGHRCQTVTTTGVMQKTTIDYTVTRSELLNQLEATIRIDINLWQGNGCYILNQIEASSNGLYAL